MTKILAIFALLTLGLPAQAQVTQPFHYLSLASTNSTLIKTGAGTVQGIVAINTTTTLYYLKFYDLAVAPTCNSTPVALSFAIPFGASNSGGGFVITPSQEIQFKLGIGFCVVGGIADSDNSNAATGLTIDVLYK